MLEGKVYFRVQSDKIKFIYSEKATKFCKISTNYLIIWLAVHRTNNWWRFRKVLWPSQNIWTLTVCHPFQYHSSTNIFLPIALSISRTASPYAESRWLELWNFYGLLCEVGLKPEIIALGQPKITNHKKKLSCKNAWNSVTKIVLTHCEKKLF